ncbi:histone H3 lysine 36 (K36) methyltransferase [Cordyceps fumosorosea ARSEF 2679]|uniref:Histone-lysine N-methyltransferase, H3 lysine-36 specific n=1 Tax=Cordyceps fumosorosea (strain ARSEF 2679) TaxID=1081104 RepID=A0A168CEP0_CORFA|nr:histone H3 lysine 36 (K36) methyltransferase [Cordyceps fumosorosea ARSEF 2679]OAA71287.1 histone H3 lysine 36 (K36) methyltransferase [Cordyceps fumosorosea ARSEF 2679]
MKDDENATARMQKVKLEDGINGDAASQQADSAATAVADATRLVRLEGSPSPSTEGGKSRTDGNATPNSTSRPRLSRKSSRKATPTREPTLFDSLPNMTAEACSSFQVITDCLYGSKHLGSTENDAFDCDCREEWHDGVNMACGEDSDCINRATKMECSETAGNCGGGCQNQRFQRKQYAEVSVIKTEKKGYGLRTDADLVAHDFIFEYIGEVINEATFRRRMLQYDREGIKHFYFMSLNKNEFVDATRKGNLGRFCNHSCVPNCYVDKWVVGDKLRMGIFALRTIRAGEELVFNYNVDRYGADPQPCYCNELNCVGFIGGKTQTERATKLPQATIEALGIDLGDGWDTTVAKKARKKRADEDDEDYVSSLQARPLDEEDSRKVMATLMQCKEKWIAVKLLDRIQQSEDERVIHSVMRMHAYQILKTTLHTFSDDHNVVLQVLSILDAFPRLTRNKIQDSNIEATVEELATSEHEDVSSKSKKLLDDWSKLEMAYRIRRRKFEPGMQTQSIYEDRRGAAREGEAAASTQTSQNKAASHQPINAPKGPRSNIPQRNNNFHAGNGPRQRQRFNNQGPLPQGWFSAKDASGNMYYYDKQGTTTWQRPTLPADQTPKVPSKAQQEQQMIQNIIARVTKEGTPKSTPPQQSQSQSSDTPSKDSRSEKWRALSQDKQMKIYENTVFPHIKYVLDKFRHKLPKDDLKRLGKELAKKLVASDYKNSRVVDPTAKLNERQARKIKTYVKDFLDRAVQKYAAQVKQQGPGEGSVSAQSSAIELSGGPVDMDKGDGPGLSDVEADDSPGSRKRKHDDVADADMLDVTPAADGPEMKRLKEAEVGASTPSPPPPPPSPPPQDEEDAALTAEQEALREQERALERENEEAQRLADEEAHRTNGEQEQTRKQEVLSH